MRVPYVPAEGGVQAFAIFQYLRAKRHVGASARPRPVAAAFTAARAGSLVTEPKGIMKVRPSVRPMCEKCKIIRRHGVVLVICENPRHKQRQG